VGRMRALLLLCESGAPRLPLNHPFSMKTTLAIVLVALTSCSSIERKEAEPRAWVSDKTYWAALELVYRGSSKERVLLGADVMDRAAVEIETLGTLETLRVSPWPELGIAIQDFEWKVAWLPAAERERCIALGLSAAARHGRKAVGR